MVTVKCKVIKVFHITTENKKVMVSLIVYMTPQCPQESHLTAVR